MGFSNSMTRLLNKIERRLGTSVMNLPDHLKKEKWADVIYEDSLVTFSRFFPHCIAYNLDPKTSKTKEKDVYFIDEDNIGGDVEILGVKDLDFNKLANTNINVSHGGIHGSYHTHIYSADQIAMAQLSADLYSIQNTGLYLEYIPPNKIRTSTITGADIVSGLTMLPLELLVVHPKNLNTISPTKMEVFEKLAIIDVKIFLYQELKHFDNLETVYSNIELKIDDWSNSDSDREDFISFLEDSYVSSANDNQPLIYTV